MQQSHDDERIRDHLANERTYLAWLRTGIATMGFGVVIAKLRYLFPSDVLTPPARGIVHAANIGLLFTIIGLLTVILSARRFVVVQQQIRESRYEASSSVVLMFTAIVAVLGVLIIWYLMQGSAIH